jgi:hypothetical protein
MILHTAAPPGWDRLVRSPLQSTGYAEAARALGHRPLFAEDLPGAALVLVRRVPVPLLGRCTVRAKVYVDDADPAFVAELVKRLRRLGVSHVRVGDSLFGWPSPRSAAWPGSRSLVYHLRVHDMTLDERAFIAGTERMIRRHIQKPTSEVTVSEVQGPVDLREYVRLANETGTRMRSRDVASVYPAAYFEAIVREMVPRRQAILFMARAGTTPLAAATFVMTSEHMALIHGCSTRDRALTPRQGPTFLYWHAMRHARARGCRTFDMGAVTLTDDPNHPHYSVSEYKRRWGGEIRAIHGAELIISPWKHCFQERVLAPMWDRLHPIYLRLFARDGFSTQEQHP